MANVVVYTRPGYGAPWERTVSELSRVPCVGEYLALRDARGRVTWNQVTLVVLIGFQSEETVTIDAEVFAVTAGYREEMALALHTPEAGPLPDR